MKIKTIKFNRGQAVAVNTYLNIMNNACEVIYSHCKADTMKNTFFKDVKDLLNDRTMDNVTLANEIVYEVTTSYNGQAGAYLKADFEEIGMSEEAFEWFVNVHNQAVETVKTLKNFSGTELTIIK